MASPIRDPASRAATSVAGIVLAAGSGSRFGMPKALATTPDGRAWVEIAAERLRSAGCSPVFIVLGAGMPPTPSAETPGMPVPETSDGAFLESRRTEAQNPRDGVPGWARVVVAGDWADGQSASLRAGLVAAETTDAEAVLVTLVDLPEASPEAEHLVLGALAGTASLARAVDGGRPAHPVLIGRDHWAPLAAELTGDRGARDYLRANAATPVNVTGLGGADDVDRAID